MKHMELISSLAGPCDSKILLLVVDGLGGLPADAGKTELELASTPNLDALAADGVCGLHDPVGRGVTPGSGPGHLALFGYDPLEHMIDRGPLGAAGVGIIMDEGEVAARLNFCTVDADGNVADRRAGRIPTEKNTELLAKLGDIRVEDVTVSLTAEREYRTVAIFNGPGLVGHCTDSDPQKTGVPPLDVKARDTRSEKMARIANAFAAKVREILAGEEPANAFLMRGFSNRPDIPSLAELYHLTSAAIALYPMYRGVASFAGMEVLGVDEITCWDDELAALDKHWDEFDYFFLHYKYTDSSGEDGNVEKRIKCLEEVDASIPRLAALEPDVLVVTGDHSTPCALKSHSWHPVPTALWAKSVRPDAVGAFSEIAFTAGGLGRFPGPELMGLMLAHAGRLAKYGA